MCEIVHHVISNVLIDTRVVVQIINRCAVNRNIFRY